MKRFVVLFVLLVLAGCTLFGQGQEGDLPTKTDKSALPTITDRGMAGKVVVVRIKMFYGVLKSFLVALDGKDIFWINSGEHTEFFVPEGEHYITVKYCNPSGVLFPGPSAFKEHPFKFVVKASETIFFLVSPDFDCPKIKLSNETEAKKHLEGSNFIHSGDWDHSLACHKRCNRKDTGVRTYSI
jgi:hypothetical protein